METWSKEKPTSPGRYWTRWQSNPKWRHRVTLMRKGRGLIVIPDPPLHETCLMSEIGNGEREWKRIE